jgi:hypothetical protein
LEVMLKTMLGLSDAPAHAPLSARRQASFSLPRTGLTPEERATLDRVVRLFASVNVHVAVQVCDVIPEDVAPKMRFKDIFGLSTTPSRCLHVKRSYLSNSENDVTISTLHAAACLLVRNCSFCCCDRWLLSFETTFLLWPCCRLVQVTSRLLETCPPLQASEICWLACRREMTLVLSCEKSSSVFVTTPKESFRVVFSTFPHTVLLSHAHCR